MGSGTSRSSNAKELCPACGASTGAGAFCPSCGVKTRGITTEEKRARLAEKGAAPRRTGIYVAVAAVAVVVLGVALVVAKRPAGPERAAHAPAGSGAAMGASAGADRVEIALADLEGGKARHYTWRAPDGKEIRFFAVKSSDGMVRAAFDACDVCWPERKGYRQEGDFMVCNNCGQAFESARVNEAEGGCNPSPLRRRVEGDRLVITAADLQPGERFF